MKPRALFSCFLIFSPLLPPLYGHIADEIAVKTTVGLENDEIRFCFDISSGVLFSTVFLKILDPDKNKNFEEGHVRAFSRFFLEKVEILLQGREEEPALVNFSASGWDYFVAGISTIVLEYSLPLAETEGDLRYELSLYPDAAVYSLKLENRDPRRIAVLKEKRNEYLQDVLELQYTRDPELAAAVLAAQSQPAAAPAGPASAGLAASAGPASPGPRGLSGGREIPSTLGTLLRDGFEALGIMAFLRGQSSRNLAPLFFVLAVAVGFLHAFTPGHGKALVGAFLIANQGRAVHALCLGLVITLAHTLSIYCFGLLASTAARFLLPGEFIPVLSLLCGLFITGLGISLLCRRFAGMAADHAHLVPNLRLLKRETVNILIDGEAAEANEAFLIACDDQVLQESLKAAGAEDFNLCSPGCSAHGWLPPALRLRQRAEYFKTALKTGAVDAVVLSSEKALRRLDRVRGGIPVEQYRGDETRPGEILFQAVRNYSRRDQEGRFAGKAAPRAEERLSWGRVISLGISGGIIPCPDALAVLLAAIAMGKLALGMGIILFFSMGLAFALVLVGMIIVFTRKALSGRRRMAGLAALLPYGSALFISVLGVLMAAGAARDLFRIG